MFGFGKKKTETHKKSFSAGAINRLTADWSTTSSTPNSDVYSDLQKIVSRSRGVVQNNGYALKYINAVKTNVIGKSGIVLQCMSKDDNGNYDKQANDQIEDAWKKWGKQCDVTGGMNFVGIQEAIIGAVAQDGEALVRIIKNYDNDFGIALQIIEADHLDVNLNDADKRIVMGVELDMYNKPIAYHITKGHPSSNVYRGDHTRIPADEIIHLFRPLRVGQVRGVPWMHAGLSALNMLDKYQEAELTAARVSAGKMGFYKTPTGAEYVGDKEDNDVIMEVEPGTFEELPQGWDFQAFDPQHPTTAYQAFSKQVLRTVASAWGISYETLSNDRESVNYSSIRQGALEERDNWRSIQSWLSGKLHERVYQEWLPMAILKNQINLPFTKIDKFSNVAWIGRGFAWVDPVKEASANILLANAGLKSHQEIVADQGQNIDDVYARIAKEQEKRKELGIITTFDADLLEILQQGVQNED